MGYVLKDYQESIIERVKMLMKSGHKRILICSPVGSGKTVLTSHMIAKSAEKAMRSTFIVHRRELVKQSIDTFEKSTDYPIGVCASGFPQDSRHSIQIASILTLANRLKSYANPDLIVWDECHHIAAKSWEKVFNQYPDAFHVGLTATPERLDGKGLGKFFNRIVFGPSTRELINGNNLSDYIYYAPQDVDLSGVKRSMGDYNLGDLETAVDKPSITGCAVREYLTRCEGKRAIVFCVSVAHSKHVTGSFKQYGITAVHLDAKTSQADRDYAIEAFRRGEIQVLSNVDLFGEGFDLPAIECAILLRPTQSLTLYIQQCGRALRTYPGKEKAIILDHVGNYKRHGLPCAERKWSLEGRKQRKKDESGSDPSIKVCDDCFAALPQNTQVCPHCGHKFKTQEREILQKEGDLVEVRPLSKAELVKRIQDCHALSDFHKLAKERGYSPGWAYHVYKARKKFNV